MKRGFNDSLYVINFICVWVFVIAGFILTIFSGKLGIMDLSIISTAVPCAFGELGIHTGFIVWKAKVENCRKHKDVIRLESLESEDLL
jgi:hypothetical protein